MQAHAPQAVVPGVDRDTEYVASLLSGHPSVPTTTRGHAHKKKPRKIAQPQHQATPSASSDPLVAQYSKPSNKSHSQQYFCEACTCWVAAREHAWNTHIKGIKHQRQLVSLQHTGQLGNVLVSVFEAVPGNSKSGTAPAAMMFPVPCCLTWLNIGKRCWRRKRCISFELPISCMYALHYLACAEPVDREQESTAASAPLAPVCPIDGERLARLRTTALKVSTGLNLCNCHFFFRKATDEGILLQNIVNLSAHASDAQRMAEHYLPQKLSEAWTNASHHYTRAIEHCGGELELLEFVPNQIVCLADLMKESCKITSFKLKGTAQLLLPDCLPPPTFVQPLFLPPCKHTLFCCSYLRSTICSWGADC